MLSKIFFLLLLICAGCEKNSSTNEASQNRKDLQSYAIASCLTFQDHPYVKDQGDAWANIIIQQSNLDLEVFAKLALSVKTELAKGDSAIMRTESGDESDKNIVLYTCYHIIDNSVIQEIILKN